MLDNPSMPKWQWLASRLQSDTNSEDAYICLPDNQPLKKTGAQLQQHVDWNDLTCKKYNGDKHLFTSWKHHDETVRFQKRFKDYVALRCEQAIRLKLIPQEDKIRLIKEVPAVASCTVREVTSFLCESFCDLGSLPVPVIDGDALQGFLSTSGALLSQYSGVNKIADVSKPVTVKDLIAFIQKENQEQVIPMIKGVVSMALWMQDKENPSIKSDLKEINKFLHSMGISDIYSPDYTLAIRLMGLPRLSDTSLALDRMLHACQSGDILKLMVSCNDLQLGTLEWCQSLGIDNAKMQGVHACLDLLYSSMSERTKTDFLLAYLQDHTTFFRCYWSFSNTKSSNPDIEDIKIFISIVTMHLSTLFIRDNKQYRTLLCDIAAEGLSKEENRKNLEDFFEDLTNKYGCEFTEPDGQYFVDSIINRTPTLHAELSNALQRQGNDIPIDVLLHLYITMQAFHYTPDEKLKCATAFKQYEKLPKSRH